MKISQFISEARDELDAGWTQREYRSSEGVCAIGALERVAMRHLANGGARVCGIARSELEHKAAEMFPDRWGGSIPGLNDNTSTVKQDMLDLFDKCTIGLEERGW